MFIKRREMKRSDWKRIIKRKYITKNINIQGIEGVAGLIYMEQVSAPLEKNGITIVKEGYKWLQIALKDQNFWVTAMFDENDDFVQIYFDVTLKNHFDIPDNPQFDDLFIDIVLTTDRSVIVLDSDELNQALEEGIISNQEYDLGKSTSKKLCNYLGTSSLDTINLCKNLMQALMQENND